MEDSQYMEIEKQLKEHIKNWKFKYWAKFMLKNSLSIINNSIRDRNWLERVRQLIVLGDFIERTYNINHNDSNLKQLRLITHVEMKKKRKEKHIISRQVRDMLSKMEGNNDKK